jgi:uncharacterized protein YgiM (DUF1202 family)
MKFHVMMTSELHAGVGPLDHMRTVERKRRLGAVLPAVALVLGCFIPGFAAEETNKTPDAKPIARLFVYAKRVDNIRSGPGTKYKVLRQTFVLERLEYCAKEGRWFRLRLPEEKQTQAWVHESVVYTEAKKRQIDLERIGRKKATADLPFGPWTAVTIARAGLYALPRHQSRELLLVPKKTRLEVQAEKLDARRGTAWAKVTCGGKTGWLPGYFVDRVQDIHPPKQTGSVPDSTPEGKTLVIATPGTRARLSPVPDSPPQNRELLRIPQGIKLRVEGEKENKQGVFSVKWYRVTYQGISGWVSEFDTK